MNVVNQGEYICDASVTKMDSVRAKYGEILLDRYMCILSDPAVYLDTIPDCDGKVHAVEHSTQFVLFSSHDQLALFSVQQQMQ